MKRTLKMQSKNEAKKSDNDKDDDDNERGRLRERDREKEARQTRQTRQTRQSGESFSKMNPLEKARALLGGSSSYGASTHANTSGSRSSTAATTSATTTTTTTTSTNDNSSDTSANDNGSTSANAMPNAATTDNETPASADTASDEVTCLDYMCDAHVAAASWMMEGPVTPGSQEFILKDEDKYNVASLKHLCTKYMVENTKSPKVQNALNWYSWAKALHLEDLIEQCAKTIAWNADNIIKSPEWLTMDNDFVTDLLQSSSLVVTNEYTLYLALTHWLEHQETLKPNSYGENVQKLMSFIRFPQMLVSQLYDIENSEISKMPEYRTLMHHLISKAYRFRSLCPAQKELKVSFNEPFYIPRDYKELMVDSVRMHNTHRFGIQVDVRTYVGPVPSEIKEGDWKITYRKNADQWILQIFCHESALVQGEARVMSSLIVYNDDEEVIQVEQSTPTVCSRGNHMSHTIDIINPEVARTMAVLIKPVPI
uniref:BACK domain-containing protein n=1 Tax=Octopus bimaculoides TaxID=37653 RepID=A0A0L8GTJ0_OCTBM